MKVLEKTVMNLLYKPQNFEIKVQGFLYLFAKFVAYLLYLTIGQLHAKSLLRKL